MRPTIRGCATADSQNAMKKDISMVTLMVLLKAFNILSSESCVFDRIGKLTL